MGTSDLAPEMLFADADFPAAMETRHGHRLAPGGLATARGRPLRHRRKGRQADAPLAEKIRHGRPVHESDLVIAGIDTGSGSHPYIKVVDRSSGDLLAVLETPAQGRTYGYCCVFIN